MGLAKGVATSDESHSLLIVHAHAVKVDTDIQRRVSRVRVSIRSLWVDIDEA